MLKFLCTTYKIYPTTVVLSKLKHFKEITDTGIAPSHGRPLVIFVIS